MDDFKLSFLDSVYSSFRNEHFLVCFREQYKDFFNETFVLTLDSLQNLLNDYIKGSYDFIIHVSFSEIIFVRFERKTNA